MSEYNQQELRLIKDEVCTLVDSNPNWHFIGLQVKEKDGTLTGNLAITLRVSEKLPADQIDSNDLFPESINIPGVRQPVKTDVKVRPHEFVASTHLTSCYDLPEQKHDKGQTQAVSEDGDWVMPVSGNRSVHRPLVGGISISIFPPEGYYGNSTLGGYGGGTLGGFAIDLDDNTIVGISCNHILANAVLGDTLANKTGYAESDPLGGFKNSTNTTYWSILSTDDVTLPYIAENAWLPAVPERTMVQDSGLRYGVGEVGGEWGNWAPHKDTNYPVYQRSGADSETTALIDMQEFKVGTVKRAYPWVKTDQVSDANLLDVAIFALYDGTITYRKPDIDYEPRDPSITLVPDLSSTTENWKQYLMNYNLPMDWATTDEIDSLIDNSSPNYQAPVFKSGRTTGPLGYPGSIPYGDGESNDHYHTTNCSLSVSDISVAIFTNYKSPNLGKITYKDQLEITSDDTDVQSGGDSGSFVCALLSANIVALSAWKVIGLAFASGTYNKGYEDEKDLQIIGKALKLKLKQK